MPGSPTSPLIPELVDALKERAKELNCLYKIEEICADGLASLEDLLIRVIRAIPSGWRYPEVCQVRITQHDHSFQSPVYREPVAVLKAEIRVSEWWVGTLEVSYTAERPPLDDGPFMKEEVALVQTLADRLGYAIFHRTLGPVFDELKLLKKRQGGEGHEEWRVMLSMVRLSDPTLFQRIARRMVNHLFTLGVREAGALLERMSCELELNRYNETDGEGGNIPLKKLPLSFGEAQATHAFEIAAEYLGQEAVLAFIQRAVRESKFSFLVDVLEDNTASLQDVVTALARFKHDGADESELTTPILSAVHVSLLRRFFSRALELIEVAKPCVSIDDFYHVTRTLVYPEKSNGQLGGKAAGLFTAMQIVKVERGKHPELADVRMPKSWHIASDGILDFIHYNHLEELLDYKYHDVDQIRMEYPNLVQLFKNSSFSPEMVKGLSLALDDFGDRPLIVRSSTLLEDSFNAAFSGKYKSLFIANQGAKGERLEALLDAVAEVYASMFSPDPIEYRTERGLLDYQEEMGVLIQEVVGTRVGDYLFPVFAGVAFSHNEFRWSPRIAREDGLIRLVPGLGTRAVDRVGEDYPVLIAPRKPNLRANPSPQEAVRYAPAYLDIIDLRENAFVTRKVSELREELGETYPGAALVFSRYADGLLRPPAILDDFRSGEYVVTFEGLFGRNLADKVRVLLEALEAHYGHPMDIEFAGTEEAFYLLQCRPQSFDSHREQVSLPNERDIPPEALLFAADRYVSDGVLGDLTHVVYVDPQGYEALPAREDMLRVAEAVSRLNTLLPKRRFVLMGPGRWGSRGDITLGVNVSYADINNTAALIELAFRKGNYVPDLSFGTHFFQDLVEASIRYLPLYPDEEGIPFNHAFFRESPSILGELLPEFAALGEVVRVIDIPSVCGDDCLQIIMSGEENRAVAFLAPRGSTERNVQVVRAGHGVGTAHEGTPAHMEAPWIWRMRMAEMLAATLDAPRFGVRAMYVIGSTSGGGATVDSDIDLLVHVAELEEGWRDFLTYIDGYGRCLGEMLYLRTGHRVPRLLHVHPVTDEDVRLGRGLAPKIGAVSDPAKALLLRQRD